MRFRDRREAGEQLAVHLVGRGLDAPVVLALPRGGVPVAVPIAVALRAPLEVFVARKLGAPQQPELGIGAIAEGGGEVVDERLLRLLGLDVNDLARITARERLELERRVRDYRGDRPLPALGDRDVVLVDDGIATGVTAEASLRALRSFDPRALVLAVPVCAAATAERLRGIADQVLCLIEPQDFQAVGLWYDDFNQTTDKEVLGLLAQAQAAAAASEALPSSSASATP